MAIRLNYDQKIWGSIPSDGHEYKCRANFVFPTTSVHGPVMGTLCIGSKLEQ